MVITNLAFITVPVFGEEGDTIQTSTTVHAHAPRRWPRQLTRNAKRPWLRCKHCGMRLVQADSYDSATRLAIGRAYSDGDVPLYCPTCGTHRLFKQRSY